MSIRRNRRLLVEAETYPVAMCCDEVHRAAAQLLRGVAQNLVAERPDAGAEPPCHRRGVLGGCKSPPSRTQTTPRSREDALRGRGEMLGRCKGRLCPSAERHWPSAAGLAHERGCVAQQNRALKLREPHVSHENRGVDSLPGTFPAAKSVAFHGKRRFVFEPCTPAFWKRRPSHDQRPASRRKTPADGQRRLAETRTSAAARHKRCPARRNRFGVQGIPCAGERTCDSSASKRRVAR